MRWMPLKIKSIQKEFSRTKTTTIVMLTDCAARMCSVGVPVSGIW